MVKAKSRILVCILAVAVALSMLLSACGKTDDSIFRVGVDDSYPPMEFKDKDAKTTIGFDVDVAKELGKRLGKKDVQFIPNDWTGIFEALEAGKFDVIISSVSINEKRLEEHSLTDPYIANKQVIVTKTGVTDIKSPDDLKDKKVGFQAGTTSEEFCKETLKLDENKLSPYPLVTQPFMDLEAGRIDAVMVDIVVAKYYISNNKEKYIIAWESPDAEPMAICFPKKDGELRDNVNKILEEMQNDGTMKTISEKWFGEDVTKNLK